MIAIDVNTVRKFGKSQVAANTPAGHGYILKFRFAIDDPRIKVTVDKIKKAGAINLSLWARSHQA